MRKLVIIIILLIFSTGVSSAYWSPWSPYWKIGQAQEQQELLCEVQLSKDWNIISLPINQTVEKNTIFVEYNEQELSWYDSSVIGIILNFVYGWDSVNQVYELAEQFNPTKGYWVYAYQECELKVYEK